MAEVILNPMTAMYDQDDQLWVFGVITANIGEDRKFAWCIKGSEVWKRAKSNPNSIVLMPGTPANIAASDRVTPNIVFVGVFPYHPTAYGWRRGMFFEPDNVDDVTSEFTDLLSSQSTYDIVVGSETLKQLSAKFNVSEWQPINLETDEGRTLGQAMRDSATKLGIEDPNGVVSSAYDQQQAQSHHYYNEQSTFVGAVTSVVLDAVAFAIVVKVWKVAGWKIGLVAAIAYLIFAAAWCDEAADSVDRWWQRTFGMNFFAEDRDRRPWYEKIVKPHPTERTSAGVYR